MRLARAEQRGWLRPSPDHSESRVNSLLQRPQAALTVTPLINVHLEPWVMLYSLRRCYIALTPAISIAIWLIDVLYSREL